MLGIQLLNIFHTELILTGKGIGGEARPVCSIPSHLACVGLPHLLLQLV